MPEKIEIYVKPYDAPIWTAYERDCRVYYAGQWVDFRDGRVVVRNDAGESLADAVRHYIECEEMRPPKGKYGYVFRDHEAYEEWFKIRTRAAQDLRRLAGL